MQQIEETKRSSWKLFDSVSSRYDLANRILSFGLDMNWRKQVVSYFPAHDKLSLVDLATGTGDQLLAAVKKCSRIDSAIGIDLSENMLTIAKKKLSKFPVQLMHADIANIPLNENMADAVTMAFGIRNVPSPAQCLREIYRILKPSGRALILEFSLPQKPLIKPLYLFYLKHLLPRLGGLITKQYEAYEYLYKTITVFPYGKAFCNLLSEAGFKNIILKKFTFGIVTLYIAEK